MNILQQQIILTLSMYHAAVHDARNNTLILVIQSQCYALHSAVEI